MEVVSGEPVPSSAPLCVACGTPSKEIFYSTAGAAICRVCYNAEQTRAQDARAVQSVAASAPAGIKTQIREETRAARVKTGWILLACCVGSTILSAFLLNRVYLWSGIIGVIAFGSFARALKLPRLDGKRGNLGVGVGIAATLLVLFGILGVTILGCD